MSEAIKVVKLRMYKIFLQSNLGLLYYYSGENL